MGQEIGDRAVETSVHPARSGVQRIGSHEQEATMPATKGMPLVTLGWQVWSILAVVLAFALSAAAYLMIG
jgi:hypothetical protein